MKHYTLYNTPMITGFPSPAQGYEDNLIDLNKVLIAHPAATVLMQIKTSRYSSAGIYEKDFVLVDRSVTPSKASIVVFEQYGEFKIGRLEKLRGDFIIFGTVTFILHNTEGKAIKGAEYDTAC